LAAAPFSPIEYIDGYLPLEDYGLIGDGSTAALVGRDGAIPWLCVPRFDSSALFCGILEAARGGAFTVAPEDLVESRQYYEPDSGVLVTEMRSRSGMVRVTDAVARVHGASVALNRPPSPPATTIRIWAGGMRILLHLPRATRKTQSKHRTAATRERQCPAQLLGHQTDELEPKGLRVPKIEAFQETDASVMHAQGDVLAFGSEPNAKVPRTSVGISVFEGRGTHSG
jgi:GH15 family glucan-1,4-alpha-glucosidase